MIRYFANHPTAANLLMLAIAIVGLASLPALKRETFPDFAPSEIEVRVVYPGASAEDVEEAICQRLDDAIDGVENVNEVRCEAREGVGTAVVEMRGDGNLDRFLDDIKSEVDALDSFPDETELPVIRQLGRTDRVVSIAITGPMPVTHLKAFAEQLKERLQLLPEVSLVTVNGFSQRQLSVRIPQRVLRQYGLSIQDIADTISRQSIDLPAGSVLTRDRDLLVRFTDQRRSVDELADLIVVGAKESKGEIRLGDFAVIEDRFELSEAKLIFNGQRAAVLQIAKTKSEDALTVMAAVKRLVAHEQAIAPPGVRLTFTQDVSSIVEDRLSLLTKNGIQGLVLVFLVMWLFFNIRYSFWVAMGLPVSFLGAFFLMTLIGYSINMLTMVALLVALGLLMDDAIVIAENIATQLRNGKRALDAAVDGVRQVAPGVLASFLTTAAVFGPLAFLEGDMGKVLRVIPVVLLLVLAVSLVEAFLILPHHLYHSMGGLHATGKSRFRPAFDRALEHVRENWLGRAVDGAVHHRYLFMGGVLLLFLVSVGMLAGGHLKFQAFPDIEGDTVEARVLLPQGTPLRRTEAVVEQLTQALARVDEAFTPLQRDGARLVENVSVQFNQNLDAHENGAHVATVRADLMTAEVRNGRLGDIIGRWRDEAGPLPDVISLAFKEPQIGPGGVPIEVRLKGRDLAALKSASTDLQAWFRRYRGVFDVYDDLRPGKPEIRLRLRDGALSLGLDAAGIAQQLRAAFFGTTSAEIQVGKEDYEIDVQLTDADQATLDDLAFFRVVTPHGANPPLASVAEVELNRGFARINRVNGVRTVTVVGDADPEIANVSEVIRDTQERFLPELRARYGDLRIEFKGQSAESSKTGSSLARAFLIGLIAIFVLLSFLFRSYAEPLLVMLAIPLAFIGVVWGHLAMGLELSMPSMIGFASLAGVVVNDSILLVEFLKSSNREDLSIADAAKRASRDRFRAVLLTSLTTIAGLMPLLFERSLQAQVLIPLVTSLVFGMLAATLLVLLVVPVAFAMLDDFGLIAARGEADAASDTP